MILPIQVRIHVAIVAHENHFAVGMEGYTSIIPGGGRDGADVEVVRLLRSDSSR